MTRPTVDSSGPSSNPGQSDVITAITMVADQIAQQYGVSQQRLVNIALATAEIESGDNPTAVGDNGTSFGLFQLHEGGELGSLTEQQAFDPTTNAQTAVTVIARVLAANPNLTDGQIAAAAQRPYDQTSYAAEVNAAENGAQFSSYDGASSVGSPQNPAGGTPTENGQKLSMSDIGAVDKYIQDNFPEDAWMLNVPQVASLLQQGAVNGWDSNQIQAAVEGTNWWKTTSASYRQYLQDYNTNPADYNVNTPGSKAAQAYAGVMEALASAGIGLDHQQILNIAQNSLKYGWTSAQIQQAAGALVQPNNSPNLYQKLDAQAGQYLLSYSAPQLQQWAQNIAEGTQTMDQWNAHLAQQASIKWPSMSKLIQEGYTPNQITDTLRQEAAKTMEVDPTQIDFINNPTYSHVLNYVPPGGTTADARLMSLSEMDQYLKGTSGYSYTQNARNSVASTASQIMQTFGMVS